MVSQPDQRGQQAAGFSMRGPHSPSIAEQNNQVAVSAGVAEYKTSFGTLSSLLGKHRLGKALTFGRLKSVAWMVDSGANIVVVPEGDPAIIRVTNKDTRLQTAQGVVDVRGALIQTPVGIVEGVVSKGSPRLLPDDVLRLHGWDYRRHGEKAFLVSSSDENVRVQIRCESGCPIIPWDGPLSSRRVVRKSTGGRGGGSSAACVPASNAGACGESGGAGCGSRDSLTIGVGVPTPEVRGTAALPPPRTIPLRKRTEPRRNRRSYASRIAHDRFNGKRSFKGSKAPPERACSTGISHAVPDASILPADHSDRAHNENQRTAFPAVTFAVGTKPGVGSLRQATPAGDRPRREPRLPQRFRRDDDDSDHDNELQLVIIEPEDMPDVPDEAVAGVPEDAPSRAPDDHELAIRPSDCLPNYEIVDSARPSAQKHRAPQQSEHARGGHKGLPDATLQCKACEEGKLVTADSHPSRMPSNFVSNEKPVRIVLDYEGDRLPPGKDGKRYSLALRVYVLRSAMTNVPDGTAPEDDDAVWSATYAVACRTRNKHECIQALHNVRQLFHLANGSASLRWLLHGDNEGAWISDDMSAYLRDNNGERGTSIANTTHGKAAHESAVRYSKEARCVGLSAAGAPEKYWPQAQETTLLLNIVEANPDITPGVNRAIEELRIPFGSVGSIVLPRKVLCDPLVRATSVVFINYRLDQVYGGRVLYYDRFKKQYRQTNVNLMSVSWDEKGRYGWTKLINGNSRSSVGPTHAEGEMIPLEHDLSESMEENDTLIQCDQCQKWRWWSDTCQVNYMSRHGVLIPDYFTCDMLRNHSCDTPQLHIDQEDYNGDQADSARVPQGPTNHTPLCSVQDVRTHIANVQLFTESESSDEGGPEGDCPIFTEYFTISTPDPAGTTETPSGAVPDKVTSMRTPVEGEPVITPSVNPQIQEGRAGGRPRRRLPARRRRKLRTAPTETCEAHVGLLAPSRSCLGRTRVSGVTHAHQCEACGSQFTHHHVVTEVHTRGLWCSDSCHPKRVSKVKLSLPLVNGKHSELRHAVAAARTQPKSRSWVAHAHACDECGSIYEHNHAFGVVHKASLCTTCKPIRAKADWLAMRPFLQEAQKERVSLRASSAFTPQSMTYEERAAQGTKLADEIRQDGLIADDAAWISDVEKTCETEFSDEYMAERLSERLFPTRLHANVARPLTKDEKGHDKAKEARAGELRKIFVDYKTFAPPRTTRQAKALPGSERDCAGRVAMVEVMKHAERSHDDPNQPPKYKARLVFLGNRIWKVLDHESISPSGADVGLHGDVTTLEGFRSVIAYAGVRGYATETTDLTAAYLQAPWPVERAGRCYARFSSKDLEEAPADIRSLANATAAREHCEAGDLLWEMQRCLYGHPISGHAWITHFSKFLFRNGWSECETPGLFRHDSLLLCVYVDDLCVAGDRKELDAFWSHLDFIHDGQESLSDFLGVRVHQSSDQSYRYVRFDMRDYIVQIEDAFYSLFNEKKSDRGDTVVKRYSRQATSQVPCSPDENLLPCEATVPERRVQKIMGMLLWIYRCARPDIGYAVSKLGSRVNSWNLQCEQGLAKVVAYLSTTAQYDLCFRFAKDENDISFLCHSDASLLNPKSQSGGVIFLAGPRSFALLGWTSTKQKVTANSSAWAEIVAVHSLFVNAMPTYLDWDRILARKDANTDRAWETSSPMKVLIDNSTALKIVKDGFGLGMLTARIMLHLRQGVLSGAVENGLLCVGHVRTDANLADGGTKFLTREKMNESRRQLGLVESLDDFLDCGAMDRVLGRDTTKLLKEGDEVVDELVDVALPISSNSPVEGEG